MFGDRAERPVYPRQIQLWLYHPKITQRQKSIFLVMSNFAFLRLKVKRVLKKLKKMD